MSTDIQSNTQRVVTRALNLVNDTMPGGVLTSHSPSGQAPGQVGQRIYLGYDEIQYESAIGTLYGGGYVYVKTFEHGPHIHKGRIAFWWDKDHAVVTAIPIDGNHAGVFLNDVDRGNYCYIQYSGKATLLFSTVLAKATPAVKDLIVQKTTTHDGDVVDDATTVTGSILKRRLGVALEAPVAGALKLVELYEDFKIV